MECENKQTNKLHLGLPSGSPPISLYAFPVSHVSYAPPILSILILPPLPTSSWWGHLHATSSTLADIQWIESNCKQYKCLFYITASNNL